MVIARKKSYVPKLKTTVAAVEVRSYFPNKKQLQFLHSVYSKVLCWEYIPTSSNEI